MVERSGERKIREPSRPRLDDAIGPRTTDCSATLMPALEIMNDEACESGEACDCKPRAFAPCGGLAILGLSVTFSRNKPVGDVALGLLRTWLSSSGHAGISSPAAQSTAFFPQLSPVTSTVAPVTSTVDRWAGPVQSARKQRGVSIARASSCGLGQADQRHTASRPGVLDCPSHRQPDGGARIASPRSLEVRDSLSSDGPQLLASRVSRAGDFIGKRVSALIVRLLCVRSNCGRPSWKQSVL